MSLSNSIRAKTIGFALSVVLLSTLFISVGLYFSISQLVEQFSDESSKQFQLMENQLLAGSEETRAKIKAIFEEQALRKAKNTIIRDALVLKVPFLENSHSSINTYLDEIVAIDADIVSALFFSVEDGRAKAWFLKQANLTQPISYQTLYDQDSKAWISYDEQGREFLRVPDHTAPQIMASQGLSMHRRTLKLEQSGPPIPVYEISIPVFEGEKDDLRELMEDGEPIGFLRYHYSLAGLQTAVQTEKQLAQNKLQDLQNRIANIKRSSVDATQESIRNSIILTLVVLGGAVTVAIFISFLMSRRFIEPILNLQQAAQRISEGNYRDSIVPETQDELGSLAASFEKMRIEVKDYTENLQTMVDERTHWLNETLMELAKTNRSMKVLLDHINQGVFVIGRRYKALDEHSHKLCLILETDLIAGETIDSLLLDHSNLRPEAKLAVRSLLNASLNENTLNFVANAHILPKEIIYQRGDSSSKIIEIEWNMIEDDSDCVAAILVTVHDVTELRQLQRESVEKQKVIQYIEEMIETESRSFITFIDQAIHTLHHALQVISESSTPSLQDAKTIFRQLHTIKGNAATIGLRILSQVVHEAEIPFKRIIDGQTTTREDILPAMRDVSHCLEEYSRIHNEVLKRDSGLEGYDDLKLQSVTLLLELNHWQDIDYQMLDEVIHGQKIYTAILAPYCKRLIDAHRASDRVTVHWQAPFPIFLEAHRYFKVRDCLTHLIRNSIDHGLSKSDDDQQIVVSITFEPYDHFLRIHYRDDGQGISLRQIRAKAEERRLALDQRSLQEVADLIFEPGFSTSDTATDVSGRGMGMDIVRHELESLGGSIAVKVDENTAEDRLPIHFQMTIPLHASNDHHQKSS
ncbi:ATP-binding protein [Pseudobacteriovorax antillogorgiicola]|nr:ATP-binding protein [Pseudobacteriovorax antillogorgiicola]